LQSDMTNEGEPSESGHSFGLFEVAIFLGENKWTILAIDLALTVLVALGSFLIPNTYTARSLLLPPQQGQSSAGSALAALGVLSAGLGSATSMRSPEELYVSLLKSDSVGDGLVERFKLKDRYEKKTVADARAALAQRVVFTAERKSGLIRVDADDRDPVFAAQLANSYSEELRLLMNRIAVTEASQRRMFFNEQARQAKEALAVAELAFKAAQERYGIQSIDVRAQGDIRAAADLRAQIMTREVQIQAMRTFAGPENADVQRLAAEVASLRSQMTRVEHGAGTDVPSSDAALANQRAYREVKYQEAILSGLITQAELARGDEARQAPLVQQVDVAHPPDRKSAPKRGLITIAAAFVGLFLGLAFVIARRYWYVNSLDTRQASRWRRVRDAWRPGSRPSGAEP
jgi:uncharacterized protein involved in exopolysaccharide biosynthesis